ncbi:MAG: helix-turn-helix domain-containing protein [Clostridia bacterium]|nr:helix-turn-helix domain-containing protein [Clostridia bacterium]
MSDFFSLEPDYVSKDEYIHINQCGILPSKEKSANVFRPNGRKDYLFLYVLSGCCILNRNSDNPIRIGKGYVVLFKPGEPQYYYFPKEENSIQIYIHFTGTGCENLFKYTAISNHVIKPRHRNTLEYYLQRICDIYNPHDNMQKLQCEGLLIASFGLISTKNDLSNEYHTQKYHRQISHILGQIQTEPHLSYSVQDWANQCNISVSQFINVFKIATGCSPYQYLTNYRISYAKELLLFTDMGIAEISSLCGYDSQNYFARIFKNEIGSSPSEFRKENKYTNNDF